MYEFIYELIMSVLRLRNLFHRDKRKNKVENKIRSWPTRMLRPAILNELDKRVQIAREDGSFQIFVTPEEYGQLLSEDGIYILPSLSDTPPRFIPPRISHYAGCEIRISSTEDRS